MTTESIIILVLIILQVADALLTHLILKRGGREMNPLLRLLMERVDPPLALVASKSLIIVALLMLPAPIWFLTAACAVYAAVVGWNAYVLTRKLK